MDLEECGLKIHWSADRTWTAYVAGRKGGVVRIHHAGRPPVVANGWRVRKGRKTWTSNWWSHGWRTRQHGTRVTVRGSMQSAGAPVSGVLKHALLRAGAFLFGQRLIPVLKQAMIFRAGKTNGPAYERDVEMRDDGVEITDRIGALPGGVAVVGPRQNLRHVASADSFSVEEGIADLMGTCRCGLDTPLERRATWSPTGPA
jgi:hypothetical protein